MFHIHDFASQKLKNNDEEYLTRKVLSGEMWLSDCPGSQSIAPGFNPGAGCFRSPCSALYRYTKYTKTEALPAACAEGKQERNQRCFEGHSKDRGLGWLLTWFEFQLKWWEQYYSHKKSSVNYAHTYLWVFNAIGNSHLLKTVGAN